MAVRSCELMRDPVATSEDDRHFELPAGHVAHVGGVVDELIKCDEREAPTHQLDDRTQTCHGRADAQAAESSLADRCIKDAPRPKLREHSFRYLVSAVVLAHFLAHEEDGF